MELPLKLELEEKIPVSRLENDNRNDFPLHNTVLIWQIERNGNAGRTRDESGDERQFYIMVLFERLPSF